MRSSRSERQGVIYFLKDVTSGLIKIGRTKGDAWKRIDGGRGFNPNPVELLAIIEGPLFLESDLHTRFAADRYFKEWFRPSAALLSFISSSGQKPPVEPLPSCFYCVGTVPKYRARPCAKDSHWHSVVRLTHRKTG